MNAPAPQMFDYPAATGAAIVVVLTALSLVVIQRFDPTGGSLTISLMVALSFIATLIFCLFLPIKEGAMTDAIIGGLVASFGAVIALWIRKDGG
jgi:hypothetical protein